MVQRAIHGAEGRVRGPDGARMGFTMREEFLADALAAVGREEDALAEVAEAAQIITTGLDEGGLEFGAFGGHGQAGGGTDDLITVQGEDDETLLTARVGLEVVALVVEAAVIEIRILAEDGDAERAECVEVWRERAAVKVFQLEAQGFAEGLGASGLRTSSLTAGLAGRAGGAAALMGAAMSLACSGGICVSLPARSASSSRVGALTAAADLAAAGGGVADGATGGGATVVGAACLPQAVSRQRLSQQRRDVLDMRARSLADEKRASAECIQQS